jgi:hypothetical protein
MSYQLSNSPGPKRVPLDQLSRPRSDQPTVEMRFVNENGDTEVWLIRKDKLDFEGLSSPERVRLAYLDRGVDVRLATQRDSIERLQRHVESHHEYLRKYAQEDDWMCNYQDPS